MNPFDILITKSHNSHYAARYVRFIRSRTTQPTKGETQMHHILPKARDFFPEYANLTDHSWNCVCLTHREHYIAHWILHKAFPRSSQSTAFYNMSNIQGRKKSRAYEKARIHHISVLREVTQRPERNARISQALSGRPKTAEHIEKLKGHVASERKRRLCREANLGRKASEESKQKMSASRTGVKRGPHSPLSIQNISNARKGHRWYNNGETSRQFEVPPSTEWVPGRLKSPTSGMKWYNNGIASKMFTVAPDGEWVPGRLPFNRVSSR